MLALKKNIAVFAALAVSLATTKSISAGEVAIIAHPSVQEDSLNKKQLSSVYRGEKRSWSDGTKIKVWDLGERGETRESFYDYMGVRRSQMKLLWMRQLLTGEGEPPDEAATQEEMIKNVIATPGAIGYVNKELVDGRVKLLLLIQNDKPDKSD